MTTRSNREAADGPFGAQNIADAAPRIRSLVANHARDRGFSGVCLVASRDTLLLHEAYGLAHRGFNVPNTIGTRFDIASVTKTFTAAAVLQLIEAGNLSLDTRIMPFLGIAGTRISDDVTVFHCLTHTSGIGDDADEEAGEAYELLFVDKPNYSIRETADFLPQFVNKEPVFPPGAAVRYNNCAFVLLGLVIERVSNMPYRDYIRQQVFARAGMSGADFCAMDGVHADLAEHYWRIDRGHGAIEWRKNIYSYPPIGSPDGGATVTAMDINRFVRAIAGRTLLGEEASRLLLAPHVHVEQLAEGARMNGFAFEFTVDAQERVLRMNKDGGNVGVSSMLAYYPASDVTVIILANIEYSVWTLLRDIERILPA